MSKYSNNENDISKAILTAEKGLKNALKIIKNVKRELSIRNLEDLKSKDSNSVHSLSITRANAVFLDKKKLTVGKLKVVFDNGEVSCLRGIGEKRGLDLIQSLEERFGRRYKTYEEIND